MSKVIKLTEKDLTRIVNKVINEQDGGKNANELMFLRLLK